MAYKIKKEYLNRWFGDGKRNIPLTDKTSQEDLAYIYENQTDDMIEKSSPKKVKSKNK